MKGSNKLCGVPMFLKEYVKRQKEGPPATKKSAGFGALDWATKILIKY